MLPAWARSAGVKPARTAARVSAYDLTVGHVLLEVGGRRANPTAINGTLPGPLLRFRERDDAVLRVRNVLDEDTSIH